MDALKLFVSAPVAGFRVAQAREYWETYDCPPPATVYGMLLSLVGEPDRLVHRGVEIAVALLSSPCRSVVLRTLWRVKNRKEGPGQGSNKRPDFQELLTDVRLVVWVRSGTAETARMSLRARLDAALREPASVTRFGGLALGESTHLVDEVRPWRVGDLAVGQVLVQDDCGDLSFPIWVDHVGSEGTRWGQFSLVQQEFSGFPPEKAWTTILPPP